MTKAYCARTLGFERAGRNDEVIYGSVHAGEQRRRDQRTGAAAVEGAGVRFSLRARATEVSATSASSTA